MFQTSELHVQVYLRMNTWMFEFQSNYSVFYTFQTSKLHIQVSLRMNTWMFEFKSNYSVFYTFQTSKLHVQVFLRMNTWMFEFQSNYSVWGWTLGCLKHVEDSIIKWKHSCKKSAFCWFLLRRICTCLPVPLSNNLHCHSRAANWFHVFVSHISCTSHTVVAAMIDVAFCHVCNFLGSLTVHLQVHTHFPRRSHGPCTPSYFQSHQH